MLTPLTESLSITEKTQEKSLDGSCQTRWHPWPVPIDAFGCNMVPCTLGSRYIYTLILYSHLIMPVAPINLGNATGKSAGRRFA